MDKKPLNVKWLAIGAILLFIGVTIAPSINQYVVTAFPNDDFVEVNTQVCGIQGYKDTTVKLTRQQYQDLEQYLVEFRAKLNQTTTKETTISLFKEAVVELNKYGLLPTGMNVEKAKNFIIKGFQYLDYRLPFVIKNNYASPDNLCCLVVGYADGYTYFEGIGARILERLAKFSYPEFDILFILSIFLWAITDSYLTQIKRFAIADTIGYGLIDTNNSFYRPAEGWVNTIGLNGLHKTEGKFYGGLSTPPMRNLLGEMYSLPGIIGFQGIKLRATFSAGRFYFGFALAAQFTSV